MVTVEQVRKLMDEIGKHGRIGVVAMRAGMDRKTARKYVRLGVASMTKDERIRAANGARLPVAAG